MPFIDDPDHLYDNPLTVDYPSLNTRDWNIFLRSRLSSEFQAFSMLQSERRCQNEYNHRLSRSGYVGLLEELRIKSGTPVNEDRSYLWLLARKGKDDEFLNDTTREVAKKIDHVKQKINEGKVETEGTNDILTLVLGTPEHGGRVRAKGKHYTPTSYFNIPRRSSKIHTQKLEVKLRNKEDENMVLKKKLTEYESMMTEKGILTSPSLENMVSNNVTSNQKKHSNTSDKRNYSSEDSSLNINNHIQPEQSKDRSTTNNETFSKPNSISGQPKHRGTTNTTLSKPNSLSVQAQECSLALGNRSNIVAKATMYKRNGADDKLHSVALGDANVRVSIHSIIVDKYHRAPLPIPVNEDITTIASAIGTFVAWPKEKLVPSPTTNVCLGFRAKLTFAWPKDTGLCLGIMRYIYTFSFSDAGQATY